MAQHIKPPHGISTPQIRELLQVFGLLDFRSTSLLTHLGTGDGDPRTGVLPQNRLL